MNVQHTSALTGPDKEAKDRIDYRLDGDILFLKSHCPHDRIVLCFIP